MPSAKKQATQPKRHLQLIENETTPEETLVEARVETLAPEAVKETKVKTARKAKAVSKTQKHNHKAGETCASCAAEEADFLAATEKLKALQALHKQRRQERETVETTIVKEELKGDIKQYFPAENVSKKAVLTVVTILALAAGSVLWNIFKPREVASVLTKELSGHHYSTADEESGMEFFDNHIVFDKKGAVPTVAASHIWVGDWTDELKLLSGQFDNAHTKWMQVSSDTITLNGQTKMYSQGSPEQITARQMRRMRNAAVAYYNAQRHYPENSDVLGKDLLDLNPISKQYETPIIGNLVGAALVCGNGQTPFENELMKGRNFLLKQEPKACQTVCLEVKSEPVLGADMNAYGWRTNAFFIQGYDRNGQPLQTSDGSGTLIYALKNGRDVSSNLANSETVSAPLFKHGENYTVCVTSGNLPDVNGIKFKYYGSLLLFALAIGFAYIKNLQATVDESLEVKEDNDKTKSEASTDKKS